MQEKDIEQKLERMSDLASSIKPLAAQLSAEKEEYNLLEMDIIEWAKKEKIESDRIFDSGVVNVNPGKPALALIQGKGGSASWDEVVTKLRAMRLRRFIRTREEPIKNRIKDEMPPETMKKIGVKIVTEPSITVEVF